MSTELSLNAAYEQLGLMRPSSLADVKSRRNWLALLSHPDKNPGRVEEAGARMADVNNAFATIVSAMQDSDTSTAASSTRSYTSRSSSSKTASSTAQSDAQKAAITNKVELLSSLKSMGSSIYRLGRLAELTAGKPKKGDALCQVLSRLQRLTLQIYLGGLGLEDDECVQVAKRSACRAEAEIRSIYERAEDTKYLRICRLDMIDMLTLWEKKLRQ